MLTAINGFKLTRATEAPQILKKSPDGQLGGALNQSLPVLGRDSTGNLGAEGLVGHHQHLQLLDVVNQNLLEARGQHVPGTGGATVTNVGHLVHPLELPPHSVVNTLRVEIKSNDGHINASCWTKLQSLEP